MISVIIPVYNGEKVIGSCLESLLKQTLKPDEIIVVDDGSIDKTKDIVKKFRKVKLIEQKHKGPAAARNLGARNAKGDILLFIDADCKADKKWVEEMVKPFKKRDVVGVQGRYKTEQKGLIARFVQCEIEERYERMKKSEYIDFIGSYSAGYRKKIFMDFGGFDESFIMASGEDPDLSFKIAKAGYKMVFNEKAIVFHQHVDSLYAYLKQKFWRAYWRVKLYRKHPDKMIVESYTPQTLKLQIASLFSFTFFFILSFAFYPSIYISFFSLILLFLLTLPLAIKNFKVDKPVALITPFVSISRTLAFALGLFYGMVRL
jgi:cellulose synthase/poly-beta-1,6-N-acetylglucosamine synthase-like glycosyltransferase